MTRGTKVKADIAYGIKPGDHVQWKQLGKFRQFGDVQDIYLSFKYPRGLNVWKEATVEVATVFVIRDRHGIDHRVKAHQVMKAERPRHLR